MRDIINNMADSQLVDPAVITSDTDSASIDLLGYEHGALIFNVGESGDTLSGSVKIELEVEESDDDSSFSDVADADLSNYVAGTNDGCVAVIDAAAEDDSIHMVQYKGSKRYIRGVINVTGTHSNGTPMSITGLRFGKQQRPVA